VTTVIARMSQYTSNTSTAQATKIAPGNLKTIGIHAGAARRIQVIAPGAASKKRAPNWRRACSQAGAGGWASITAIDRLCPPHSWGIGGQRRRGSRNKAGSEAFVFNMKNLQHLNAPPFGADVLNSPDPVVVIFTAGGCPPCNM